MKLSDIKGERVFDVIADIIEPVTNIAQDKDITLFKRETTPDGMTARSFAIKKISKNAPLLLKRHKHDISTLLAVIKGQTVDEYVASLNMATLSIDLLELLNDQELISFFMSAAQTTGSSGDASETTEAPAQ